MQAEVAGEQKVAVGEGVDRDTLGGCGGRVEVWCCDVVECSYGMRFALHWQWLTGERRRPQCAVDQAVRD